MARDTSHGALRCCCSSSMEKKKTSKKINSRARILRRKAACALGNRGLLWTAQTRPKQPRAVECVVGGSVSSSLRSCRFHGSQAERALVERVSHDRARDLCVHAGVQTGALVHSRLSRLYTLYRSSRSWNSLAHGKHPRFPVSYPGCPWSAGMVCSLFLLGTVISGRCRGDVVTLSQVTVPRGMSWKPGDWGRFKTPKNLYHASISCRIDAAQGLSVVRYFSSSSETVRSTFGPLYVSQS